MPDERENHSIPAAHVLQLAEVVARWGITADELFDGLDLDVKRLEEPLERVSLPLLDRLAVRARTLTREPALGVYLGMQMRVSAHGYLGFAAMTSSTVREALEIALRFAPTRTSAIVLRLHVDGDISSLVIDERVPLGAAQDIIILALMVGIEQIASALTGKHIEGSADVTFPRPDDFERFDEIARGRIRFDQPVNQLLFPSSMLDLPIVLADPVARRLAQEQCERELDALGHRGNLAARVRALVPRPDGGFHSLEEIAAMVHVSPRTLKRKLADQGTGFSELLEQQQRERALMLLRSPELSLENIAERVGYSDVANFTRAFRRWTGLTPGAYRRAATKPAREGA
ncbi:MAG TPA: AraC family transcriptional regulator [Labilithrix sp.]|nr:AraC family transcriptional regulator [Labilithrix sp.]